jgi:hypothetical protein
MIFALACERCGNVWYRTRKSYGPGDRPPQEPEAYDSVNGAPLLQPDSTCPSCTSRLKLVRETSPSDATNGHVSHHSQPSPGLEFVLFQAQGGESVKEMRNLPNGNILVITDKRIVLLNLIALMEASHVTTDL